MSKFLEVTDRKTNEKVLLNTSLIIEIKDRKITVANGYYQTKFKTVETYDELRRKLDIL